MLENVWFGDDVEEDVEFLVLGWGIVMEAVVAATREALVGTDAFVTNPQLWGDLPETYPEFAETLRLEIKELETKCPV